MPSGSISRREAFGGRFAYSSRALQRRDARDTACPGKLPPTRAEDEEKSVNNVVVPSVFVRETTARVAGGPSQPLQSLFEPLPTGGSTYFFFYRRRRHRPRGLPPYRALTGAGDEMTGAGRLVVLAVFRSDAAPSTELGSVH